MSFSQLSPGKWRSRSFDEPPSRQIPCARERHLPRFPRKSEQHLPHGVHLEATRNSKGWFVMTIVEIKFVHVNEQPYVVLFGTSIATNATRFDVDSLPGRQR